MATSVLHSFVYKVLNLSWLAGPIFGKELRVCSRRRRNYMLRFAYLALLTVFVAYAWTATARLGGLASPTFQISRMAQTGRYLATTIVWFQFAAIQLIAVVMLSTAISDEIVRRTLAVLMTTPINSLQIVIGKLSSRLLQLVLLLGVSLPLLAIIRVFGGVPWSYVISSLCVTLTAAAFAGSLSLAFSIYNRQAHAVIVRTVLVCFLLYVLPLFVVWLVNFAYQVHIVRETTLAYVNPFVMMSHATRNMLLPSSRFPTLSWPLHCAIMAGASALLLGFSTLCVRRVGLCQATGQAGLFSTRKERRAAGRKHRTTAASTAISSPIRRTFGPPIVWKEMMSIWNKIHCLKGILGVVLAVVLLAAIYGFCAYMDVLGRKEVHMAFIGIYLFFGLLRTATVAATSITAEKEARTWPLLLITLLTEKQIVLSKIGASCLAGSAFWSLLAGHVAVFSVTGGVPIAAILPLVLLVVSSVLLVSAVGVFFSSCFTCSSTSASVNTILFLWFAVPICQPLPVSPIVAAIIILGLAGGWVSTATPFLQADSGGAWLWAFISSGFALIALAAIYLALAFAAFAIAVTNIRRRRF